MPRLAWFTPLPPVRSGIAAYSAELLPLLAADHPAGHPIDVFTEPGPARASLREDVMGANRPEAEGPGLSGTPDRAAVNVFGAHDFLWKHDRQPYDLIVYQLGNAACHDFMWPHLARFPGLVVLHDGQLHHERSRALLSRGRVEAYRAEFRYNHPDAPEHLPDLIESTLGGSLYYLYPMLRWVVRTARLVAVHTDGLAADIREAHPGVEVRVVPMGVPDPITPAARAAATAVRQQHGLTDDKVVFAAFGLVTPEKRISAALRGLARTVAAGVDAHLLLVGGTVPYYDAAAEARSLGLSDRVRITGYVADEGLPAYLLAADVCLCLRWPTSRETSAMWIRAIAAGRPTIITDLAHTADVPSLDARTWQTTGAQTDGGTDAGKREAEGMESVSPAFGPVAIAVDLLDEEEALRLAMGRLATDRTLRAELGGNARGYWQSHHAMTLAVEGYRAAIARALARPAPRVRDLPAHLLDDGRELGARILSEFGAERDLFD